MFRPLCRVRTFTGAVLMWFGVFRLLRFLFGLESFDLIFAELCLLLPVLVSSSRFFSFFMSQLVKKHLFSHQREEISEFSRGCLRVRT